jgi:hypothetical protein
MRSLARLFSSSRRAPPKAVEIQSLLQPLGLPHVGVQGAVVEWVDPALLGFRVMIDEQFHAGILRGLVAQVVHCLELPGRIDMEERKGRGRGVEGLLRQVQHHGGILADRIEHHRLFSLGDDLAHDVDAFGLQPLQMGEARRVQLGLGGRHGQAFLVCVTPI